MAYGFLRLYLPLLAFLVESLRLALKVWYLLYSGLALVVSYPPARLGYPPEKLGGVLRQVFVLIRSQPEQNPRVALRQSVRGDDHPVNVGQINRLRIGDRRRRIGTRDLCLNSLNR